ncbi:MAG: hypothetical protein K9L17_06080 [Clostridiales bacterium]|nr:hypothetical protein [Clostridiales bacterium]MCF8022241.1 hypothetical protein [Clostridiales bacterium]
MIMEGLVGPLTFAGGIVVTILLVPWERIKELSLIGVIGGLGVALLLVYLMQNIFGLWMFHGIDLVYINKIPLFLSAAWIPLIVIFSHLLAQYKHFWQIIAILFLFPGASAFFHLFFILNDMLTYNNWNLFLTGLVSLGIHLSIMIYLYSTGRLENILDIADFDY